MSAKARAGKQRYFVWLAAATAALFSGCMSLPNLHTQIGEVKAPYQAPSDFHPPTVADLIKSIQCEILLAAPPYDVAKTGAGGGLTEQPKPPNDLDYLGPAEADVLTEDAYVASATLTADILVNEGASPSLSFISPRSVFSSGGYSPSSSLNLTKTLGAQWTGTQHKQYTQTFTIDLRNPTTKLISDCKTIQLQGALGLAEILKSGLNYAGKDDLGYEMPPPTCDDKSLGRVADAARPVFGSTIDFTIVYGLNGGATWSLLRFKGPTAGGNQGLLNFTNTQKNTLVISFAPSVPGGYIDPSEQISIAGNVDSYRNFIVNKMDSSCSKRKLFLVAFPKESGEHWIPTTAPSAEELNQQSPEQLRLIYSERVFGLKPSEIARLNVDGQNTVRELRAQAVKKINANLSVVTQSASDATRAAQQNNTQMILQNLLNNNPQ